MSMVRSLIAYGVLVATLAGSAAGVEFWIAELAHAAGAR